MLNLGAESTIDIDGRTFRISRVTVEVISGYRDWIRAQIGDPFDKIEKVKHYVAADELTKRIGQAEAILEQLESFSLSCPLCQRFMGTEIGLAKFWHMLLLKHQPKATLDDALDIVFAKGKEAMEVAKALELATGKLVPNADLPADQILPAISPG